MYIQNGGAKVSVIIPVFNCEKYLKQCLNSVSMQTLKNIEIICIDDGSTDNSLKILREYADKDVRFKVFTQSNRGVSVARNKGIENATGEYIAFVDADDYIQWEMCEIAYKKAIDAVADIVVFGGLSFPTVKWIDQKLDTNDVTFTDNSIEALININGSRPFIWNKLYKRDLFEKNNIKFDESLKLGEDQVLQFMLFPKARIVTFIPNKFYYYRQNREGSAMAFYEREKELKLDEHLNLVKKVYMHWSENGLLDKYGEYFANWCVQFIGQDILKTSYLQSRELSSWIVEHIGCLEKELNEKNELCYQNLKKLSLKYECSVPSISIIMPVYNAERYLRESLESILRQTYTDFELICVDDGSTDSSRGILRKYADVDERLTVLTQENKFAGVARNYGMSIARGKYLLFLDSDDLFELNMLQDAYEQIEKFNAEICVFGSDVFDQPLQKYMATPWTCKTMKIPANKIFSKETELKDIYQFTTPAPWNKLFRKDFIEKFDLKFQNTRSANDMLFVMTALSLAEKIVNLDKVLLHYRVNAGGSLQSTQKKNPLAFYEALIALKESLHKHNLYNKLEQPFKNFALDFCLYNLGTLKDKESFVFLYKYLKEESFQQLDLFRHDQDYYYAYPSNKIYEKMTDVNDLDIEYYIFKYKLYNLMQPKVSIILPSLNVVDYIQECIWSACKQSLKEIEIICVDAGSTDGTLEIIEAFVAKDARVKLIRSDKKSYGYQMNLGLAVARGKYIGILETDDYVPENMYGDLYRIAEEKELDFIKADFYSFTRNNGKQNNLYRRLFKTDKYYNRIINTAEETDIFHTVMNIWSGLYNREFLEKFSVRFNETPGAAYQDNGFWFQTFCYAQKAYFLNKAYYMNRRDNPNSSVFNPNWGPRMIAEYNFIYDWFQKDLALFQKFKGPFATMKYYNLMAGFEKAPNENKITFAYEFAEEMAKHIYAGEYERNYFSDGEWYWLQILVNNPVEFYERKMGSYRDENGKGNSDRSKNLQLTKELKSIKNSRSYRIGKFITWLPRKVRGGIRCYQEHGAKYTIKRLVWHIRNFK